MKGSGKFIIGVGLMSSLFLFFVHVHVSIFDLSYDIHSKSQSLGKAGKEYRLLKFQVDQLKSPQRLSDEMKKHALELGIPGEVYVLRAPLMPNIEMPQVESVSETRMGHGIADVFGRWVNIAQAKTVSAKQS